MRSVGAESVESGDSLKNSEGIYRAGVISVGVGSVISVEVGSVIKCEGGVCDKCGGGECDKCGVWGRIVSVHAVI